MAAPTRHYRARFLVAFILFQLYSCNSAHAQPTAELDQPPSIHEAIPPLLLNRRDNDSDSLNKPLDDHTYELAHSRADIDAFRSAHNLTLISASPQDAALMPSWPQALLQYVFVAPPINYVWTRDGKQWNPWKIVTAVLAPFLFVGWTVSFGLTQLDGVNGGWLSMMGWATWYDFMATGMGAYAYPLLLFQWTASFAVIIQRWTGAIGSVAYVINDLHGCQPVDGLAYLEQGARAKSFRIFQTVVFSVATVTMVSTFPMAEGFNEWLALPALAELIYTAVIANLGTPMVVSGNCMLVELNPSKGFLDSNIDTRWKAFGSFMGF